MKWSKKILYVTFVFFLTIIVAGYFSYLGIDPHHDGIILKPASDVAHGQMLFRDTFTQYGALTTLIQGLAIMIWGHYLVVINLLTVFFYGLIAVLLFLIWNLFLPELLTLLACVIWLFLAPYHDPGYFFLPWPSVYALFFQLVTLYTLLRFIQTKKWWWCLTAGVTAALTFWNRQSVGFFLTGSIVFYFLVLRFKKYKTPSVIPFFISTLTTHLIFVIWLLANNAFGDWLYQTVHFPAVWATSASPEKVILLMNFVGNLFPVSYSPLSIWTLMPICILYLGFTSVITKRFRLIHAFILLVVCINLASWLQYHPVYDPRHWYWAATPMIGFAFYTATHLGINKKRSTIFLVICLLLFVPDMFYHARLARRKIRKFWSYPTLTRPEILKGMRVPAEEKRFFDDAMDKIEKFEKTHPSSFIITTAGDALYPLFDGKNKNCFKLTVDWGWSIYLPSLGKEYTKTVTSCIARYQPAIFTKKGYYHPEGYIRATKNESQMGYYLLLPVNY